MKTDTPLLSFLTQEFKTIWKLRNARIRFSPDKCNGTYQCIAVCPVGCWTPDRPQRKVIFHDPEKCIAFSANHDKKQVDSITNLTS